MLGKEKNVEISARIATRLNEALKVTHLLFSSLNSCKLIYVEARFQVIDTTYTFVSKNDTKLVGMVQHLQNEHRMYRCEYSSNE